MKTPELQTGVEGHSLHAVVRTPCRDFADHDFQRVGTHRVPCHVSWYQGMPAEPDGTIEYTDYRCALCGQRYSEETLYSWRPNVEVRDSRDKTQPTD
jgi:hypothetical protein